LKYQEKKYVMVKNKDHGLWHKRFGHPSNKNLNIFFNTSLDNNTSYDICRMTKQTKLPFNLLSNK
jgi:GAG-pre-integrase domain